jgi:hypothetical protein
VELLRRDKKAVGRWPKFVLIDDMGQIHMEGTEYAVEVSKATIEKVLACLVP